MAHFNTTLKRNSKLDLSRPDLLKLVSMLEGELQAREIVIAVLKSEQIKRLLNPSKVPLTISGFKNTKQLNLCHTKTNELTPDQTIIKRSSDPLVALSRDSFFVYEPSLDHSTTLALYNIKIFQLENFINSQKKLHAKEIDRIKFLENICENLMLELEEEKRKNKENENTNQDFDRQKLEAEIEKLKNAIEEIKDKTKQMIFFLLDERKQLILRLNEVKRQNDELKQDLTSEKNKNAEMVEGLEDESKRSLQMEAELEKYLNDFEKERTEYKTQLQISETKNLELMTEIERLKNLVEVLQNQIPNNSINKNKESITNNFNDKEKWNLGEGVRSSIVTMPVGAKVQSLSSVNPVFHPKASVAQPITSKNVTPGGPTCATTTTITKSIQDMNPNIILPPPSIPVPQPKQQQCSSLTKAVSSNATVNQNSFCSDTLTTSKNTQLPSLIANKTNTINNNNNNNNNENIITENNDKLTAITTDNNTVKQTVKFYETSAANQIKPTVTLNNSATSTVTTTTNSANITMSSIKKPSPGPRPTPPPIPPNKPSIKPVLPVQALFQNKNSNKQPDSNAAIINNNKSIIQTPPKTFNHHANTNSNNNNAQTTSVSSINKKN